jgi:hypothetical protein
VLALQATVPDKHRFKSMITDDFVDELVGEMLNNKLPGFETAGVHRETQTRTAAAATAAAEIEAAIPDVNRHRLASFGQKFQQPGWTGMGAAGQLLKDSKIAKRCVVCARPGSGRPLGSSTTHYCSAVTCGVRVALCQEGGGHHDRHCLSMHKSECEAMAAAVEPRAVNKRRASEPASWGGGGGWSSSSY